MPAERLLSVVAFAAMTAACSEPSSPPIVPPLDVEFAGCERMLAGPVCMLPEDREIRLWVRAAPGDEVELTGGTVVRAEPVQAGRRLVVEAEESAVELRLELAGSDAPPWALALRELERLAWRESAVELFQAGKLDEAERYVESALKGAGEDRVADEDRGSAVRVLGVFARVRGDEDETVRRWREAAEIHRGVGRAADEIGCRAAAFHLVFLGGRLTEARELLDDMPPTEGLDATAAIDRDSSRALLAGSTGDLRTALRLSEQAMLRAERVGVEGAARDARHHFANQLRASGRRAEALELLSRQWQAESEASGACARGQLANSLAWHRLLALEAGDAFVGPETDPIPGLEIALEAFRECPQLPAERVNVHTNLALAHVRARRPLRSREHLERARELDPDPEPRQELWWLEIEGRIALSQSRPEAALASYQELGRLAAASLSPEAAWRAAIGAARAREALADFEGALGDYARGEALLDDAALRVPIAGGRAELAAGRERGTRFYLDLLLRQGRAREAQEVARRARSRILRHLLGGERISHLASAERRKWQEALQDYWSARGELDAAARDTWRLPADELRFLEQRQAGERRRLRDALDRALLVLEPAADAGDLPALDRREVRLLYHPLPEGWVGFAEHAGGLTVRRIDGLAANLLNAELARRLIEPFSAEIEATARVRILSYGFLRRVDFHALPYGDDVLLAARPVVYGLDLPWPAASGARSAAALLVADPGGDLEAARLEARAVRQALGRHEVDWRVEALEGADAAGDAVRRALLEVELFHYAGHGDFAGWHSALPLAAGTRLTVGDVLALHSLPRQVVLSGCETGRASADAPAADGSGLAQAFLAAGSHGVIAAVRPIDDELALELVRRLYPAVLEAGDEAKALQQAQLALRRQRPDADWASFRIVER
ncbi:MAG: CHAT domain-containing protein [bacterium]|nr:CHAT domain-containing protein [bacterium]